MKKIMKGFTAIILSILCFIGGYSNTVYADELSSNFTVKFVIVDSTDGYEGTSFTVQMDDIMGEVSKEYEIKKAASWANTTGNIPSITIPAPTTYNLTINGLDEGYKLRDYMSGSDIDSSFAATNNGEITFYWEIVADDGTTTDVETEVVTDASATSNVVASVYDNFLNTVSFIQEDSTWSNFLEGYHYPSNLTVMGKMYAACVNNEDKTTEEMIAEYEAMSDYDKFLWYSTYLEMAYAIHEGHSDQVNSSDAVLSKYKAVFNSMEGKHRNNESEVVAAYEELLQWQADYIAENGSPFNFINNRSYLEEMGVTSVQTDNTDEEEITAEEQKEIDEAIDEIEKEENEERGIWSDTLDILSSNLITILILVVLLCGLGFVVYTKKKNNFTDEIHEK